MQIQILGQGTEYLSFCLQLPRVPKYLKMDTGHKRAQTSIRHVDGMLAAQAVIQLLCGVPG